MARTPIAEEIPGLLEEVAAGKLSLGELVEKYGEDYPKLTYISLYNYCKKRNIDYKKPGKGSGRKAITEKIDGVVDDLKSGKFTVAEICNKYCQSNPGLTYERVWKYCKTHNIEMPKKLDRLTPVEDITGLIDDLESGDYCIQDVLEKYQPTYHDLTYGRIWEHVQKNKMTPRKRRQFFNEDFFFTWTPELAYILGWLVSDGYVFDSNGIGLTILKKDAEVLEDIRAHLECKKPIRYASRVRPREGDDRQGETYVQEIAELRIFSPRVCEYIAAFGLVPNKTDTIGWIKEVPEELAHHFIRGVFDGDGSVFTSSETLHFNITGNRFLLEEIQKRLNQVVPRDINGSLSKAHGRVCWQLTYANERSMTKIFEYMYANSSPKTRLRRKYNRFVDGLYRQGKRSVQFDDEES